MRRSSLPVAAHGAHAGLRWRAALAVVALAVLVLALPAVGWAAPQEQEQKPVIAQPEQDAVVRGVVQIVGTATHSSFQRYELYYTPWPVASDNAWIFIGPDAHYQPQPLGVLGTWDSRAVPDGGYGLRVRVVRQDGNYFDSDPRRVTVANVKPAESPTQQASPSATPGGTPTAEPTMEPTATIMVELPGQLTPTAAAGITATVKPAAGTPTAAVTPILSGNSGGGDDTAGTLTEILSGVAGSARRAAVYTLGAFVALGLFFAVKALLVWAWHKVRP
jgi:hypothetical protein